MFVLMCKKCKEESGRNRRQKPNIKELKAYCRFCNEEIHVMWNIRGTLE